MPYPSGFLTITNFELAFQRILNSGDGEYKNYYRHLLSAYGLTARLNVSDLISDIRKGTYAPSKPTVIFLPKRSGVLRPIALLSLADLIVYQAIANIIARSFESDQQKYAYIRTFGAIYAGPTSAFFFQPWKNSYKSFSSALSAAFNSGARYYAEFDLVSFYELIDHTLLRTVLLRKVRNVEILDLLFDCLRAWTGSPGRNLGHGVPQGPEPSAFLAECLLFLIDGLNIKGVNCFRYIDDIKLLGDTDVSLKRALIRLDLVSKDIGLVPQAQKISPPRLISSMDEILTTVPSLARTTSSGLVSQRAVYAILRSSIQKKSREWIIADATRFKFALFRLNPRLQLLRRLSPLLVTRPDLAPTFGAYFRKFSRNREAANKLHAALRVNPVYDLAAASYIEAMDICEPSTKYQSYRKTIRKIHQQSEEHSILLPLASGTFFGRRYSVSKALGMLRRIHNPLVLGLLVHRLFGDHSEAPFATNSAEAILEQLTTHADPDLARYTAALLLSRVSSTWRPVRQANFSVWTLFRGLGLSSKAPYKQGILETFFRKTMNILIPFNYKLALRADLRDAERRCIRLQKLMTGDPTARVMMLDTFNEVLLQSFCAQHPRLAGAYKKAAGRKLHPDYGTWLNQPHLQSVLPYAAQWCKWVHDARVKADLAHAKQKAANARGAPTLPISWKQAKRLMGGAQRSWAELVKEWSIVLVRQPMRPKSVHIPILPPTPVSIASGP